MFKLFKTNINNATMMSKIKNINANMTHVVLYHAFLTIGFTMESRVSGTTIKQISVMIETIF